MKLNGIRASLHRGTLALVAGVLLLLPTSALTDQAQYYYDDLGRLSTVVDEAGNTAVYNYDAVGNLLSLDRFTPPGSGIGIYSLLPASGSIGSQVKIQGYGFSTTPANNTVTFNGTAATVSSSTAYSIAVTVPSGATSGSVVVTNSNGSATSPQSFTILTPTITGISPARGAQGAILVGTITGTSLAQASTVTFSNFGIVGTILVGATATSLPVRISVGASVPAGTYTFSVSTAGGVASSGSIVLTVAPPVPTMSTGKGISVMGPRTNGMNVVRPLSVSVP